MIWERERLRGTEEFYNCESTAVSIKAEKVYQITGPSGSSSVI